VAARAVGAMVGRGQVVAQGLAVARGLAAGQARAVAAAAAQMAVVILERAVAAVVRSSPVPCSYWRWCSSAAGGNYLVRKCAPLHTITYR